MSVVEENNQIIEEIRDLIKSLDIENLENKLLQFVKEMQVDNENRICDERIAFNTMNKVAYFLNRIIAVNEVVIGKHATLSNRIQQIQSEQCIPCGISYMDMPINNSIFAVRCFYRNLHETYNNQPGKYICLGILNNMNGRELKCDMLSDSEKAVADELNLFIIYVKGYYQLEALINLCKNINYNFCKMENGD